MKDILIICLNDEYLEVGDLAAVMFLYIVSMDRFKVDLHISSLTIIESGYVSKYIPTLQ